MWRSPIRWKTKTGCTSWLIGRSTEPQEAFMSSIAGSADRIVGLLLKALEAGSRRLSRPTMTAYTGCSAYWQKIPTAPEKTIFPHCGRSVPTIAEKGIDRLGCRVKQIEFALIEGPGHSAKGVVRFIRCSEALYDADPLEMLDFEAPFQTFRESLAKEPCNHSSANAYWTIPIGWIFLPRRSPAF